MDKIARILYENETSVVNEVVKKNKNLQDNLI